MMDPIYIYPGSFCPPTYGHAHIVAKAAESCGKILIVCSRDEDKDENWFSMEECVNLWKAYHLPEGVEVTTLPAFQTCGIDPKRLVMIRGIRDDRDFEHEKKVMFSNRDQFGIDKYLYITGDSEYVDISSTQARIDAENLELKNLAKSVAPLAVTVLQERAHRWANLFVVVGKPGGGKSTLLSMLAKLDARNVWINTDKISEELKPEISAHFKTEDLVRLALDQTVELKKFISTRWLKALSERLSRVPPGCQVFVEVPYALMPEMATYRYVGGKILYVGCDNDETCRERVLVRGTPEHLPFIERIPNLNEAINICLNEKLSLRYFSGSRSLGYLPIIIRHLNRILRGKENDHGRFCPHIVRTSLG